MILLNGESLAYLGDAIFELKVREYLLQTGIQDVNKLHQEAIKFCSGQAQANMMSYLLENNLLSETEITYYKRGRNSNHSKNGRAIGVIAYKMATGFEALLAYLYLDGQKERLTEIMNLAIKFVINMDIIKEEQL